MLLECSRFIKRYHAKKALTKRTICRPFPVKGTNTRDQLQVDLTDKCTAWEEIKDKKRRLAKEGGEVSWREYRVWTADVIQWHLCHFAQQRLTCLTGIPLWLWLSYFLVFWNNFEDVFHVCYFNISPYPCFSNFDVFISIFLFFQMLFY